MGPGTVPGRLLSNIVFASSCARLLRLVQRRAAALACGPCSRQYMYLTMRGGSGSVHQSLDPRLPGTSRAPLHSAPRRHRGSLSIRAPGRAFAFAAASVGCAAVSSCVNVPEPSLHCRSFNGYLRTRLPFLLKSRLLALSLSISHYQAR